MTVGVAYLHLCPLVRWIRAQRDTENAIRCLALVLTFSRICHCSWPVCSFPFLPQLESNQWAPKHHSVYKYQKKKLCFWFNSGFCLLTTDCDLYAGNLRRSHVHTAQPIATAGPIYLLVLFSKSIRFNIRPGFRIVLALFPGVYIETAPGSRTLQKHIGCIFFACNIFIRLAIYYHQQIMTFWAAFLGFYCCFSQSSALQEVNCCSPLIKSLVVFLVCFGSLSWFMIANLQRNEFNLISSRHNVSLN